jgi:hypothetical protein
MLLWTDSRIYSSAFGASFCRPFTSRPAFVIVGLISTGVQRHEIKSQTRLISRPDRGRQLTDGCGPLSRCTYTKGREGLGAHTTKFAVTYFLLLHHPQTDH